MNIIDYIKQRIRKSFGNAKREGDPNDERLTYISDAEAIARERIRANRVWYLGDGDELLNYYTNQDAYGFARNATFNRNKRNYFWGLSATECHIKRVHSGLPKAIIDTLVNAIGMPEIGAGNPEALTSSAKAEWDEIDSRLADILEANDFTYKLMQQARPLTLVEGWGAWAINIKPDASDHPILEWYTAENVEFVSKSGIIVGVILKSYYKVGDKDYVLLETRRGNKVENVSTIEFDLLRLERNNEVTRVSLDEVPELAGVPREPQAIYGLGEPLAVPMRFFHDPLRPDYGRSVFEGRLDVFDDLDQSLSQRSHTCRVSTPVEYYEASLLRRDAMGNPVLPSRYDRDYVAREASIDGDGNPQGQGIVTTQPNLNFNQYNEEQHALLSMALTGLLSPATMGIDVAKRDNADAQREKEKVTIMTRNNVIERETASLKRLARLALMIDEYMRTGSITLRDYPISVKYDEFANPSFENELQVLGNAWLHGSLSTRKYAELLWGGKLSDEELEAEIAWLDENRAKDDMGLEALLGDENAIGRGISGEDVGGEPTGGPTQSIAR